MFHVEHWESVARHSIAGGILMSITAFSASEGPKLIGPYSPAVRAGDFIFCSGAAGFDPKSSRIVEGGIRAQTAQTLRNLEVTLKAAGSDLSRVVKVTVFLHDWKSSRR
jgi:2-iminobutanoate/2-iminopropanoate deaminase